MPIQAPQWTDYLNCPVCCREFGAPPRSPVSLGCGHTLCRHCLNHLHKKQCPFDQTLIQFDPDDLVVNTALLQLAGYSPPAQPYHPPSIQSLPERDQAAYDVIVRCMEHLAVYLKYNGNGGSNVMGSRLSRPMQRKLVTLLQCAVSDEEGRGRMARAARSLGERTVTELILQNQNPQQISAYLWAAVRSRGCQFLGPAMQEEVLKLVLLALEDGSALSRKVLVMFVVQRLKPHFPQASKTSIGHVVQLLYRASCFKVSKRECDSSLMQLKEEFRTYESLRREHDAQIVQIATESGLRIAPDQWSALLYGDTAHKSHMQSIIDKLQTPQSFAQSVHELFIALHRTGDPSQPVVISMHLERLASIDASPDAKSPTWQQLADIMTSLKEVVCGLSHHLQQQNRDSNHNKHLMSDRTDPSTSQPSGQNPSHKFDASRPYCNRTNTYPHTDEETDRFQWLPQISNQPNITNGNFYTNVQQSSIMAPTFPTANVARPALVPPTMAPQIMGRASMAPNMPQASMPPQSMPLPAMGQQNMAQPAIGQQNLAQPALGQANLPQPAMVQQNMAQPALGQQNLPQASMSQQNMQQSAMGTQNIAVPQAIPMPPNGMYQGYAMPSSVRIDVAAIPAAVSQSAMLPQRFHAGLPEEQANIPFAQGHVYQVPLMVHMPPFQSHEPTLPQAMANMGPMEPPVPNNSPYTLEDMSSDLLPEYRQNRQVFEPRPEATWPQNNDVYNFNGIREMLPNLPSTSKGTYGVSLRRLASNAAFSNRADDQELEEELQALEQRICTEFKSTD